MALNIKNEHTVALVRELASKTGQSQTSAIEEAVAERLKEVAATDGDEAQEQKQRHRALVDELTSIGTRLSAMDRKALRTAESDLYDEAGLPQW